MSEWFNLRVALSRVTTPWPTATTDQKRQYSDDLSRVFSEGVEGSMQSHFPNTYSGGGTGIPAASVQGIKSVDVAFNIEGLFLGLGISVKTVGLPEPAYGYVHNLKRIGEEWTLETINYRRYMPYSIIVGMLFLPLDAARDRKQKSSLARSLEHFRAFTGRPDHRESNELMERIYVGVYQPRPLPLYGAARFIEVVPDAAIAPLGLPPKTSLLTFEAVKDDLVRLFRQRNPRLKVKGMPVV